jgi:hypothetical protein
VMLGIETAHGHYDVLAAREGDDAPAGATHTVFGDGGSLAGYASDGVAWGTDWAEVGRAGSLSEAAAMVAAVDGELLGFSADGADFRGVDGPQLMDPQPVRGGCPKSTDERNAQLHASGFFGPDAPLPRSEYERIAATAATWAASNPSSPVSAVAPRDRRGGYVDECGSCGMASCAC